MTYIDRNRLFVASCLALLVTSLTFGIRAGVLLSQGEEFNLTSKELGTIVATAFWGFPIAVIIGGMLVDIIGMKKLLVVAFLFHLIGISMTIFADGYWTLFISTLLIGMANGTVEAACNPLVTALYPEKKSIKLNHFHLWFPGGIFIGTLIVFAFNNWLGNEYWVKQVEVAVMIIPTLVYGYLFSRLQFPVTERVAAGVSTAQMYKSLSHPLFIFMIICMFGTAITELFTGQWIDVLLSNITDNAILILTITTGVMVLGRSMASPILGKFSSQMVLLLSAIFSAIGLYILGNSSGELLFLGAFIFGVGVCYFWPTMIGFVAENLPKTGAVGINLMGGAGMLAVSLYLIFMGEYYDKLLLKMLPSGAQLQEYLNAAENSDMANALVEAKVKAGPDIINTTLFIPIILIIAFLGLVVFMKNWKSESKPSLHS